MDENNKLIKEEEIQGQGYGKEYVTIIPRPDVKEITVKLKQGQKLKVEII